MRIPRDIVGDRLIRQLRKLGYEATRQRGSHVRLTKYIASQTHHVTIPLHKPLKVGTLNAILSEIADALNMDKAELIQHISSR